MNRGDATQLLPPVSWSDPRVHLLDDTWLLTIFAILLATAVPWLVSAFDIDFIAAALGLLALGSIHIALTIIGRPVREGERRTALAGLHVAGIVIVGWIWLHAGGLQNPAFLLVFALPVVGSIFLSSWQPYLMALLAVVVAAAVALAQAPELRWYAPGLNAVGAWLAAVLGQGGAAANVPFAGFYAPSGYFVVLLEVFAILVFACAVAAEYLGTIFERLHSHVDVARAEAERGQEFWTTLIEDLPLPVLLVDADTLDIVCASEHVTEFGAAEPVNGKGLFEVIRFSYPDVIQELVTESGGTAALSMIKVADRLRATEVHVQHIAQKGRRFALVVIQDKSEELTMRAALDVTGQATLVLDSRDRVLAYNKPARALFATVDKDADAARLLSLEGTPPRWWEPGLTGRRKMHIEVGPRVYQVTCSASPLPGEEEQLYIITFMPIARAAVGDQTAVTAHTQISDTLQTSTSGPRLMSPPARFVVAALCLLPLAISGLTPARVLAAEVDARPPDRLTLSANGSSLTDTDGGVGGSISWLHYFTPEAIFGVGAEHQTIADAQWTFGTLRGSLSFGEPATRSNIYAEAQYGQGDDNGRDFDHIVGVLGISQSFTNKFSVQLEGRQIDIDQSRGNLPKLGLTYVWSPHLLTNVAYAHSFGGNLGTEITTLRIDHYGQYVNFMLGGAFGSADPAVVNLQPGLNLPARNLKEGFIGVGKSFSRGELQLFGDYLELADSEKVTVTLTFTAYLGSRGRAQ
jgi:PAS domain-containing protein